MCSHNSQWHNCDISFIFRLFKSIDSKDFFLGKFITLAICSNILSLHNLYLDYQRKNPPERFQKHLGLVAGNYVCNWWQSSVHCKRNVGKPHHSYDLNQTKRLPCYNHWRQIYLQREKYLLQIFLCDYYHYRNCAGSYKIIPKMNC